MNSQQKMASSSSGSLILPVLIWDNTPPDCQISSLMVSETEKFIFTGTSTGHIIMWDFSLDEVSKTNILLSTLFYDDACIICAVALIFIKISPVNLIIGHTSVVNCLAKAGSSKEEEYIVSSSENG